MRTRAFFSGGGHFLSTRQISCDNVIRPSPTGIRHGSILPPELRGIRTMSRRHTTQWLAAAIVGLAASAAKADTVIDLTTGGSSATLNDGSKIFQVSPQTTGTGVF